MPNGLDTSNDIEIKLSDMEVRTNLDWLSVSQPAFTPRTLEVYMARYALVKDQIDQLGAEVYQRQEKMRLIKNIISEINKSTDDKNNLDLTNNPDLQEKLRLAKELGVVIIEGEKFDPIKRDRLLDNLQRAIEGWAMDNQDQTQKMELLTRELDRYIQMGLDIQRNEKKTAAQTLANIK